MYILDGVQKKMGGVPWTPDGHYTSYVCPFLHVLCVGPKIVCPLHIYIIVGLSFFFYVYVLCDTYTYTHIFYMYTFITKPYISIYKNNRLYAFTL